MNSVHIQLLKKYVEREDQAMVKRVIAVLGQDTEGDTMEHTYSEVVIKGNVQVHGKDKDIQEWLKEFEDITTKEPGLTNLAEFAIDTGTSKPIAQTQYTTPIALRESVDRELDWLLAQRYIHTSDSPWASPLVTVRKPDGTARICVDFKHINELTTPLPFYMPRVEEVLEAAGRSRIISKMDLSK